MKAFISALLISVGCPGVTPPPVYVPSDVACGAGVRLERVCDGYLTPTGEACVVCPGSGAGCFDVSTSVHCVEACTDPACKYGR